MEPREGSEEWRVPQGRRPWDLPPGRVPQPLHSQVLGCPRMWFLLHLGFCPHLCRGSSHASVR